MSSSYTSPDTDYLGQNPHFLSTTPLDATLLPQHNHAHSTSPAYTLGTPGESISEYSEFHSSEYTIDDEFFGVNFDAELQDQPPSNILSIDTSYPPPLIHSQTDFSHLQGSRHSGSTTTTSRYPISPVQSNTPSTPSPRTEANDIPIQVTISQQHDLTAGFQRVQSQGDHAQNHHHAVVEYTPDQSGSSNSSTEGVKPFNMAQPYKSPQVTISQWPSREEELDTMAYDMNGPQIIYGQNLQSHAERDQDAGIWRKNETTGQAGIDPEHRRLMDNNVIPNLNEQEELRHIRQKNSEVKDWVDHTGPQEFDQDAGRYGNQYAQSETNSVRRLEMDECEDLDPLDDSASVRENRPRDGDIYYNLKQNGFPPELSKEDLNLIVARQWNDAPTIPQTTDTTVQPPTSNAAIMRFTENADRFSVISRRATWGTRRMSEPSIADIESITNGSFLKKMTINDKGLERRPTNIFDSGLGRLAKMIPKKSTSNLKRAHTTTKDIPESTLRQATSWKDNQTNLAPPPRQNSSGSLAPPIRHDSFGRKQAAVPSINTAFAAMAGPLAAVGTTHARSGSVSATPTASASSPKSPGNLSGFARAIKRARSRSDLPPRNATQESPESVGLAGLWGRHGGPPVPNTHFHATSAPADDTPPPPPPKNDVHIKLGDIGDQDEDEDDDDEEMDDIDQRMQHDNISDPIEPNYDGFKAHIRKLNPVMDPQYSWLVSRIAHQQEVRYKGLLNARVKHSDVVRKRSCPSGKHCTASGGQATLYDVKGKPRETGGTGGLTLMTDFDDDSNSGDGALTVESFPQGVPMPPTRSLPAEFECQLCFKSKRFQKPSDWTKHVHEDVQPFTCTYDKCKEPKSFKRKADWVRHENERHRHLEWWVCQFEDCRHPCYRKDNFLQHLVREHKLPEPKQKTKAAIKKSRQTEPAWVMLENCHHETKNKPQDEACKFCGKTFNTWKKLTVHLAKHMEHISLPVIKLVAQRAVDADTIISPVENNMTPVTPMPKMENGGSPFSFHGVSPVPPVPQSFSNTYQPSSFYSPSSVTASPYSIQPQLQTQMHPQVQHSMSYNQGPIYTNAIQYRMEPSRGFGPLAQFSGVQEQPHMPPQHHSYALSHSYIPGPPGVSDFHTSNMLGISDSGFGLDGMPLSADASFQIPVTQSHGDTSPYDLSPHPGQLYYP